MTAAASRAEEAPDSWSAAPVGNTVALAVLALTGVYFLLVPQAALFVAALGGGVAVTSAPVAVAAALTLPLLYARERRHRGPEPEAPLDDRYAS